MRGWLRDTRSYLPPVKIGEVMRAGGLGSVEAVGSGVQSLKVGDKVEGIVGTADLDSALSAQLTSSPLQAGRNMQSCPKRA